MSGFDLPDNYTKNPEALLRKNRSYTVSSSTTPSASELVTPAPSATTAVNMGARNFELRTGLIMMVQANQFCSLPSEDTNACNAS